MDDVVGVLMVDRVKGERGALCWGRLFDVVDPAELLVRVARAVRVFGLNDIVSISLCNDLAELSEFQYFYEGIISFASAKSNLSTEIITELKVDERAFQKSVYMLGQRKRP